MSKKIEVAILTTADLKGVSAVQQALASLAKANSKSSGGGSSGAANAFSAQAKAANAASVASAKLATADSRAAAAASSAATAAQRNAAAVSNASAAQARAEKAALSLAVAQTKATQAVERTASGLAILPRTIERLSGTAATQFTDSFKAGLLGIAGPAVAATAAIGGVVAVARSFEEAFTFKAQLDATTASVKNQLEGFRDAGKTYDEASAFGRKYNITQQETNSILQSSIGSLRRSTASVTELESALIRLQSKDVSKPISEAARALAELESGDVTSIKELFRVSAKDALAMRDAIVAGGDSVQVLNAYLDRTQTGMHALDERAQGVQGRLNEVKVAQEDLTLAQAKFAEGPGLALLEEKITLIRGATRLLSGDFEGMGASVHQAIAGSSDDIAKMNADMDRLQSVQSGTAVTAAAAADAQNAYTRVILEGGTEAEAAAAREAVLAQAIASTAQAAQVSTDIEQHRIDVLNASAALSDQAQTASLRYADSLAMEGVQARAAAQATELKSNADKVASLDAQTHAIAEDTLNKIAERTAQALLNNGAAGAREAALLASSSSLIDQRTAAYYRLAAAMRAAGAGATQQQASDFRSMEVFGQTSAQRVAALDKEKAADLARSQQLIQTGTAQQKVTELQRIYNDAVRQSGASSAVAINAQTALLQATEKGGAARASAAGAAATKLEGIETKTGDKLSQIVSDTQAKLVAIDQKAAAERARIAQELNNKIATTAADRRASAEADDLDLIGVTDAKQAQALNDREKAQAAAREREVAAAKEAQDAIANGEAESASKVYDIRETQIGKQQDLDEKYAQRQRELAGNDEALAALKTQYDEGTRANEEAAQTRINIAKAEAEQKKAEVQAEKDAVIAAANEQANQVVSAAERSAQGVTKATAAAKTAAVGNLKAIGDAVNAIPSQKTITITVNQQGTVGASSTGGGGGTKAAGGGTFIASRPMKLIVGDAPSPELVTVSPLGKAGQTSVGPGWARLAGGGTVVDAGGGYTTPIAGPTPTKGKKGGKSKKAPAVQSVKDALAEQKEIVALLSDMIRLRHDLEEELRNGQPFNVEAVEWLARRAAEFTLIVRARLVPTTKAQGEQLKLYTSAAKDSVGILSDVASLRHDLQDAAKEQPFNMDVINGLVLRAQQFTEMVRARLVPTTESEANQAQHYADAVSSTVGILSDVAKLRHELQDAAIEQPFDMNVIRSIADQAMLVVQITRERLIPTTEAETESLSVYADLVGASVSILSDVLSLGKDLKDAGAVSIRDDMIISLADQAVRIATIVKDRLIPASKEQAEATGLYADLVGSSVSALKDVASLTGKLFTDYTSPTDAQIGLLATDAQRVTAAFAAAASVYSKDGLEQAKLYAESVGAVFTTVKDGLLAVDALNSGDFVLKAGTLDKFATASMDILSTTERLGARAAQIPASDIAALQTATAAVTGQAEALIRLAAVPFGDLASSASGYAQSGGALGGMSGNVYMTINALPGMDVQALGAEVIRQLEYQVKMHR